MYISCFVLLRHEAMSQYYRRKAGVRGDDEHAKEYGFEKKPRNIISILATVILWLTVSKWILFAATNYITVKLTNNQLGGQVRHI